MVKGFLFHPILVCVNIGDCPDSKLIMSRRRINEGQRQHIKMQAIILI
jgi:hypothetical protein